MKAVVALALIALAALGAGCGDDEEPASTAAPTTTKESSEPATTTEEESGEEDELTIERTKPGESIHEPMASDPEYVLELFFTSGDPDLACGRFATENLLSAAYGDEKGCRQAQVPAAIPDGIEIKSLDVSGDEAQATVIPDGGPNDGIETEVELIDEDEVWKVDSLEADIPAGP